MKDNTIHYTSRDVIMRVIKPLFLDEISRNPDNASKIKILDPSCGRGDFLKVCYEELLKINKDVTADQFYGIEIDQDVVCILDGANITRGNALRVEWPKVDYIVGNPPFAGVVQRSDDQRRDMPKGCGVLDYAACWILKADSTGTDSAFVVTNSICQGQQVDALWSRMKGVINFAETSFEWDGAAQVHCVIIGFGKGRDVKIINDQVVKNICPYLIEGAGWVKKRRKPLCDVALMSRGNQPTDGGNLLFSEDDKNAFLAKEPKAEKYIKKFVGAREFINNIPRYCLWLVDASPSDLRAMPEVMKRVQAVKEMRLASRDAGARKLAERPTQFREMNNPENYLLFPQTSSERREYLPIGYMSGDTIASNLVVIMPNAKIYEFGILTSQMHMAWMRVTSSRLKSDYQYSSTLTYNTFPWPSPTEIQRQKIKTQAQHLLDIRQGYLDKGQSYADLYDPLFMPPDLLKAHKDLDICVDLSYDYVGDERFAFLKGIYERLVND